MKFSIKIEGPLDERKIEWREKLHLLLIQRFGEGQWRRGRAPQQRATSGGGEWLLRGHFKVVK